MKRAKLGSWLLDTDRAMTDETTSDAKRAKWSRLLFAISNVALLGAVAIVLYAWAREGWRNLYAAILVANGVALVATLLMKVSRRRRR